MNEHIQNLNEGQAKIILEFAMQALRDSIYTPDLGDAARLGFLTQKIESLSKENTTKQP